MANDNHANYAKIGFALVLGTIAILGTLIYLGGVGNSKDEFVCETYYDHPVTGLSIGSEVNFRGVKIGEVSDISFVSAEYDDYAEEDAQVIVIRMNLNRRRCRLAASDSVEAIFSHLLERGLRATVSSSGITGLSKLELNLPRAGCDPKQPRTISWCPRLMVIPPEPSMLDSFADSATQVMNQINKMDFSSAWSNVSSIATSASQIASSANAVVESQRAAVSEMMDNPRQVAGGLKELVDEVRDNPSLLLRPRDERPLPETAK